MNLRLGKGLGSLALASYSLHAFTSPEEAHYRPSDTDRDDFLKSPSKARDNKQALELKSRYSLENTEVATCFTLSLKKVDSKFVSCTKITGDYPFLCLGIFQ